MGRKFIRLLLIATLFAPPFASLCHTAQPSMYALARKIYPNTVADTIENITPAVVAINIEEKGNIGGAAGTGVIIDPEGLVLTAWHVVRLATRIEVTMYNGLRFTAKTLKHNANFDLAVLQIQDMEGVSLPYLPLGNADTLRRGQRVVAISNDLNKGHNGNLSATSGIISALNRQVRLSNRLSFLAFETDLRVQEGCSGGPVCDLDGTIVGMQFAIGFNHVKAYAIPITDVVRCLLLKFCEAIKAEAAAKPEAECPDSADAPARTAPPSSAS